MLSPLKTCLSWLFLHITFHWSPQGNIVALMLKRCHSSLVYQDTHKSVHVHAYWECQWQTTTYLPFFSPLFLLFCSFIFLTSKLQYSRVSQSVSSRWAKSRWFVFFFILFCFLLRHEYRGKWMNQASVQYVLQKTKYNLPDTVPTFCSINEWIGFAWSVENYDIYYNVLLYVAKIEVNGTLNVEPIYLSIWIF